MSDPPMRRTGRGGAGNFYTQREAKEILHRSSETPHPHISSDSHPSAPTTTSETPALTGRGGAGNYVSPDETIEGVAVDEEARGGLTGEKGGDVGDGGSGKGGDGGNGGNGGFMEKTKSVVAGAREKVVEKLGGGSAYVGRGGAGNFKGDVGEKGDEEGEEEKRRVVEEGVRREAEAGLKRPEGVYLGSGRVGADGV